MIFYLAAFPCPCPKETLHYSTGSLGYQVSPFKARLCSLLPCTWVSNSDHALTKSQVQASLDLQPPATVVQILSFIYGPNGIPPPLGLYGKTPVPRSQRGPQVPYPCGHSLPSLLFISRCPLSGPCPGPPVLYLLLLTL